MHSTEERATIAVYTALSPNLKGTSRGYYLNPMDGPTWPSQRARNKKLQDQLWKCTLEVLKDYLTPEVRSALNIS